MWNFPRQTGVFILSIYATYSMHFWHCILYFATVTVARQPTKKNILNIFLHKFWCFCFQDHISILIWNMLVQKNRESKHVQWNGEDHFAFLFYKLVCLMEIVHLCIVQYVHFNYMQNISTIKKESESAHLCSLPCLRILPQLPHEKLCCHLYNNTATQPLSTSTTALPNVYTGTKTLSIFLLFYPH